jgi:hypothetical protein
VPRANVRGRFGRGSRLVKVDFAFLLVKTKFKSPYVARVFSPRVIYENVDIVFIEIYRIRFASDFLEKYLQFKETLISFNNKQQWRHNLALCYGKC